MINSLKATLSRNITNARGWRTNRKIVVIESDDWGAIRMPNLDVKTKYENLGYEIGHNPYCAFDTIANSEDLIVLFECLKKFNDSKGNNPIITLNTVVGNPVFEKIANSGFEEYFYEPFVETLKRYYPYNNVFQLWKEGIQQKLIKPQYHGREHVNVPLWLRELKKNNRPLVDAFDLNFWGIPEGSYEPKRLNMQASYDSNKDEHFHFYQNSVVEGLELFENIFGYKSTTFIANNYTWSSKLDAVLKEHGVIGFQGMKYQKEPINNNKKRIKKEVYTGKENNLKQLYLVRNCIFEPAHFNSSFNSVGECLKQMEQAFFFKKPAIISSHRLNFIGQLSRENRNSTIKQFETLLASITEKWPDVEFLSSDELVTVIINDNTKYD